MSEKKVSDEELTRRIDQLLNVLKMISADLSDISKSLKAAGTLVAAPPTVEYPRRTRTIEDVRVLFSSDLEEMLTFEESKNHILIKPRGYLGSDNFAKIFSIVRDAGGEYISAGKKSHFKLNRKME